MIILQDKLRERRVRFWARTGKKASKSVGLRPFQDRSRSSNWCDTYRNSVMLYIARFPSCILTSARERRCTLYIAIKSISPSTKMGDVAQFTKRSSTRLWGSGLRRSGLIAARLYLLNSLFLYASVSKHSVAIKPSIKIGISLSSIPELSIKAPEILGKPVEMKLYEIAYKWPLSRV